jgi:two-component system cell cycle sensor histidine kinase/response regulator CckA
MLDGQLGISHLQVLLDSAPTALLAVTDEGVVVFSNKLAQKYFLYSQDELKGKSVDQLIPTTFRSNHFQFLKHYFNDPSPRAMGVGRKLSGLRSNGDEFPIEIGLNPIRLENMQLVIASIIDISERKKLEQRYEIAIQRLPEGLLIVSKEGRIDMVNLAIEQMFGYGSQELIGQPVEILVPTRLQGQHFRHHATFNENPSARRMGMGLDLNGKRKDGSEFPVEIGLNPVRSSDGTEIIVTVIDISSRRKLEHERYEFESKIQHTQKLESLGVLAGGIAHDFNNILTGVLGNAELALMNMSKNSVASRYIEHILEAAHRAAELCNQMLAYSGKNKFIQKPFSLNEMIESTSELVQASVSKRAIMKFSLTENLPSIVGDPTQIRQVIMNLVINASEAITQKNGLITIATGVMDYNPVNNFGFTPYDSDVGPGRYVYMTVSDNGQGIDPAVMEKIFEPFFTTKFTGRGLGLAAVLGIIRGHGGTIRIYSELGKGTTFRILFPYEHTEADTEHEDAVDQIFHFNTKGNVLIIDDEKGVHQVVGDTLKRGGFNILSALDGREGLRIMETSNNDIVLVILDLTMPFMNGDEVYRKLREMDGGVPVIITSGYSEDEISSQFVGRGIEGFLHKPVSPSALLKLVREVLEK